MNQSTSHKKQPEIRFRGFSGDWVENELGTKVKPLRSYSLSRDAETNKETDYRYIHYGDIHKQNLEIIKSNEEMPCIQPDNFDVLEKGDLILADASEDYEGVGSPCVIDYEVTDKVVAGLHTIAIRPTDSDSIFLYYLFKTNKFKGFTRFIGTGTKVVGISSKKLLLFSCNFPLKTEQTTIGNFFQQLDDSITLHKRKHQQTQQLKKAMLTKLFPQKEQTQPDIRLQGFSGDWVEKRLGGVAIDFDNLRVPVRARDRVKGLIPYYGANGIQDHVDGYTHQGSFTLIAEDGANDLENYPVQFVTGKLWVNNHAHVLQGLNLMLDTLFLVYRIKSMNISQYLVGGSRAKLNGSTLKKIIVLLPNKFEEQTAIGNFLKQLDDTLALQAQQITTLENLKKAFLQKMFV